MQTYESIRFILIHLETYSIEDKQAILWKIEREIEKQYKLPRNLRVAFEGDNKTTSKQFLNTKMLSLSFRFINKCRQVESMN